MRCNCETAYCPHAGEPCPAPADGLHWMAYVGHVCPTCAQHVIAHGGVSLLTLPADVSTLEV